jgi:uncharacterized protein with ParB-like and HNH nuclease domain
MSNSNEIKSEKILIKDVFEKWFNIPGYQRPYVWGYEEIHDLLDDVSFAAQSKPDSEYFLGSFVYQIKPPKPQKGQPFEENDLLDGQQRMTTLLLLMAVLRDLSDDTQFKDTCQECLYQKAKPFKNIPERVRLRFEIRDDAKAFAEEFLIAPGGTSRTEDLAKIIEESKDLSVRNMALGIGTLRKFFQGDDCSITIETFLSFLLNQVLMIYVATEDLEDAFRLFMILNDRGIPLRNSDILKSQNLGALESDADKARYARLWEEAEGELGDDFDRFLGHIRTILVKDKARLSLLQEFEDKIYHPKERDKTTKKIKPVLLKKGKDTFVFVELYLKHYKQLLGGQNFDDTGDWEFENLVRMMTIGLPATDWVPPLLRYYDRFKAERLTEFLRRLDNKFSADWLAGQTPTDRIAAMNGIIQNIDAASSVDDVLTADGFSFDSNAFLRTLEGPVYGRRFAKYVVMKLDYLYKNHDQRMHFETVSVEHILPQNPADNSQWIRDFTPEQREEWTNRMGNLVIITRRKNSSQGRLDFAEKVQKYFQRNIDTCPNSLRVLKKYDRWTPVELAENHETLMAKMREHYGVKPSCGQTM